MANRVNTVMQPCFFALSGVLPADEAIGHIKASVEATYGKRGRSIVERNFAAIDASLGGLQRVEIPSAVTSTTPASTRSRPTPPSSFGVSPPLLAGEGDLLPVSALPIDGVFPTGTAKYEKRSIARDPDLRSRRVHRLRTLRGRVPARRDPHEGLRPGRARRCA